MDIWNSIFWCVFTCFEVIQKLCLEACVALCRSSNFKLQIFSEFGLGCRNALFYGDCNFIDIVWVFGGHNCCVFVCACAFWLLIGDRHLFLFHIRYSSYYFHLIWGIIISAREVKCSPVSLYLFVQFSVGLLIKDWTDLPQTWWRDGTWAREEPIKCWCRSSWRDGSRNCFTMFLKVRVFCFFLNFRQYLALMEVCALPRDIQLFNSFRRTI